MNVRHMQCSHPVERQSHSAHQLAPKDPNQFHVLLPPIPRMRPLFSSSKFVLESSMKRSSFQIMTVVCPPAIHSRTMNKALLIRGHPSQYSTLLRALPKVHLCHQFRRQNIFSFWNPLVPFRPCLASLVLSNWESNILAISACTVDKWTQGWATATQWKLCHGAFLIAAILSLGACLKKDQARENVIRDRAR